MRKPNRFVIKLSGEAFAGETKFGIEPSILNTLAQDLVAVAKQGYELGIVIGAGNIFRGERLEKAGLERSTGDHMGMLGTIINALALQNALEQFHAETRVLSAIPVNVICEPYIRRRAVRHLEKGRIVIFAGGTGNPYFTTDTTAALRSIEIGAHAVLKATKVDGIYTSDPMKDPTATRLDKLSYDEVISKNLRVMDQTAFTLCKENNLPIVVFNMLIQGNIQKAVVEKSIGSIVGDF